MDAAFLVPVRIGAIPFSLRMAGNHRIQNSGWTTTRIRSDIGARIRHANIRFDYRSALFMRSGNTFREGNTDFLLSGCRT